MIVEPCGPGTIVAMPKPTRPGGFLALLEDIRDASVCPAFSLFAHYVPHRTGCLETPLPSAGTAPAAEVSHLTETWVQRIQEVAGTTPLSLDPGRVELWFHSGWLGGVSCQVAMLNRTVKCKIRCASAYSRDLLQQSRRSIARALQASGLALGGFEVTR